MIWRLAIISMSLSVNAIMTTNSPLEVIKQWDLVRYNFEWDAPINDKSFFNPENTVATGIAIGYDRIYLATPRLFSGVAATLSSISRKSDGDSPVLEAFPNWSFHTVSRNAYNCSDLGLVSVYRLRIDSCNRLWALDSGVSRSLEDYEITCPPKILVFDLSTNQVVRRIDFPREVRRGESLFTNLVIDETTSRREKNCDDVFVYISDTVEPALVVYDSGRDLTWRVSHPAMYPDPDFGQSDILGDKFVLMDGVVGLAFDQRSGIVYFQPLATDRLFSITTAALRAGPPPGNQELPIRLVGKKSSQGIGLAVSPADGSIFFSPLTETAISSWNPNTNEQRLVAQDQENLQFAADITTSTYDPGSFYIVTSKFQRFFLKNLNTNEVNTRILRIDDAGYGNPAKRFGFAQPVAFRAGIPNRSLYSNQYFTRLEQPYMYKSAGVANKGVKNPFTTLNAGEQIPRQQKTFLQNLPSAGDNFLSSDLGRGSVFLGYRYAKENPTLDDYNGLRFAKSIAFNTTVLH